MNSLTVFTNIIALTGEFVAIIVEDPIHQGKQQQ
jgi:hypothetical protein